MGETKQRAFRLTSELLDELNRAATARNISVSAMAELLLANGLKDESAPSAAAPASMQAEAATQQIASVRKDVKLLGELLSFFVFQWLCYTPPLPEETRAAMVSEATIRHKRFLQILATKLARGEITLGDIFAESGLPTQPRNGGPA